MKKPILLISSCLDFEKVRYNGQSVLSPIIQDLKPYVTIKKVCPEFGIGLGVPREPIRIVKKGTQQRLVQHNTNLDVTDAMNEFSQKFADELQEVDGFIFKSKSPSMGVSNIKVYSGMKGSPVVDRCGGFFSSRILEKYPNYPVEEEDRLRNKKIRDHFLTRLFLFADYRISLKENQLKKFHQENQLLLDFYDQKLSQKINPTSDTYFDDIKKITLTPPTTEEIVLFFNNLIGDKKLTAQYHKNQISYETLKEVSKLLIKDKEILKQSFFNPYPKELLSLAEEDRNKNYWKSLNQA